MYILTQTKEIVNLSRMDMVKVRHDNRVVAVNTRNESVILGKFSDADQAELVILAITSAIIKGDRAYIISESDKDK